jgi:nucleoside-diphosphate-sugar epimerase
VVLVSSLAAAGPAVDGAPLTESAIPHPINAYGRSKRAQELLAEEYCGRVPVVIVRPPVVYGPRDTAVLLMFRTAALRLCPRLVGGTEKTCMIHVEDLARALRLAGERGAAGSTYFVTDGEIHDTLERRALTLPIPIALVGMIARITEALTPRGVTPVLNEEKVLDLSQKYWICSDARARQDLGYASQWTLEAGLRQTATWYRAQGWLA